MTESIQNRNQAKIKNNVLLLLQSHVIFLQVFNIFAKAYEKKCNKYGLNGSQWITLWSLYSYNKPLFATDISRLLPIEAPAVSILLDKLQDSKLIKRRRSKTDKRKWEVILTVEGQQLVETVYPEIAQLIVSVFGILTIDDVHKLNRLLLAIRDNMADLLGLNKDNIEKVIEGFNISMSTIADQLSPNNSDLLLNRILNK